MQKKRYQFSDEVKQKAVDEYVSGKRRAEDIARELEVPLGYLYKWRVQLSERAKGERIEELENNFSQVELSKKVRELEAELAMYQKKMGEMTLIQELLKKRLQSKSFQERSELTGLIETLERAAQKEKRVK